MASMHIHHYFDSQSNTYTYVVAVTGAGRCAVMDPVMDFDYASGTVSYVAADQVIAFVRQHGWQLDWVLETCVHADHFLAGQYIQQQLGGRMGVGERISEVQATFAKLFNTGEDFIQTGCQFDKLLADNEGLYVGGNPVTVLPTPGHTPACVTYLFDDEYAFLCDILFILDFGILRCDFPDGDARQLFQSIQRLLALPGTTRLYMGHDYQSAGRSELMNVTTVKEQRQKNIHVHDGIEEDDFVQIRTRRDAQLPMPRLLMPAVQVNMRGGQFPSVEGNGQHYLKIPIRYKA